MLGLLILGLIDIIAGILLIFNISNSIVFFIGIFILLKGIWSIITGASAGFYFDIPGLLDLAGGLLIILIAFGIFSEVFVYFGLILIIKGLYSGVFSFISHD